MRGKILTVSRSRASWSLLLAGDVINFLKICGIYLKSSILSCSYSAAYTSKAGKIYSTVSLNVRIFKMFSKSSTKFSLSVIEYFLDLGSPSLIRPFKRAYFGVSCSLSKSTDSVSESGNDSSSESVPYLASSTLSQASIILAFN